MKISIVIPTLNEELYLPKLFECIKNQTFKDYEVIVADANSKDKTVEVAKKYGAIIVKGGMPAVGRNNGAKIAKGEFIFFFDADVKIPPDFLKNAYSEMQKEYMDLATCELEPISNLPLDKFMFDLSNLSIKLSQDAQPICPGCCILVTKRLFDRIDGFDETLKMAEDHDFANRASRFRPLHILESTKMKVSVRRFTKEGRLALIAKYLKVEIHKMFKGELKKEIFEYEFGNYKNRLDKQKNKKLISIEKQINKINRDYSKFAKKYLNGEKLSKNYDNQITKIKKEFNKTMSLLKKLLKIKNKKIKK